MSTCPVCGAEITEDFGIVECESCRAQLVIHLDGRVEHAGVQVSNDDSIGPAEDPHDFIEPMREFDAEPELPVELPPELPDFGPAELEQEFTPTPGHDPLSILDMPDDAPAESYDSARKKVHAIDSADLADVAKFANSAESGGRDGSLRYTLFIEGIDTADVREAFKEAITDKKLLWDTENILRGIKQGVVKIENVSSAKAHIVVTRLKLLPISISWEQHAIHES